MLTLMSSALAAALAADSDLLYPSALTRGDDGRLVLVPSERTSPPPEDLALMAPELAYTGPTPAALVFVVAALGVEKALGSWSAPPSALSEHARWHEELTSRLMRCWPGQADAVALLARCLQADPLLRPHPRHLLEALTHLGARAEAPARSKAKRPPRAQPSSAERWLKGVIALMLVLAVLLVLLASFGLGLLYMGESAPAARPPVEPPKAPGLADEGAGPQEPTASAPAVSADDRAVQAPALEARSAEVRPAETRPTAARPVTAPVPAPQTEVQQPAAPSPGQAPAAPAPAPTPAKTGDTIDNDLIDPWEDP